MSFTRDTNNKLENLNIGKKGIIKTWLREHKIFTYEINEDFSIDVDQSVNLSNYKIDGSELPSYIQFNLIRGWFNINKNNLTTLRGCPYKVLQWFSCESNQLENLDCAPKFIEQGFYGQENHKLTKVMAQYYVKTSDIRGPFYTDQCVIDISKFPSDFDIYT